MRWSLRSRGDGLSVVGRSFPLMQAAHAQFTFGVHVFMAVEEFCS